MFEKLKCGCDSDLFKISICGEKVMCHICGEIWEILKLKNHSFDVSFSNEEVKIINEWKGLLNEKEEK